MIIKKAAKRKDGRTSFRSLGTYLFHERDPETGEAIDRTGGEMLVSDAVISDKPSAIWKEMHAVSGGSTRCRDPVGHFVISWAPGEQPSPAQVRETVEGTATVLGFGEHQWVAVPHRDGGTFHVHMVVNRVHPQTGRVPDNAFDYASLRTLARELEQRHGWRATRDMPGRAPELSERSRSPKAAPARAMETYADRESLEGYLKREVAPGLRQLAQRGMTAEQLVGYLKHHGVQLEPGRRGGYVVASLNAGPNAPRAKASSAFRGVFDGKENRARIEQLGPLPHPDAVNAPRRKRYTAHRPVSGDELERDVRGQRRRRVERVHQEAQRAERDRAAAGEGGAPRPVGRFRRLEQLADAMPSAAAEIEVLSKRAPASVRRRARRSLDAAARARDVMPVTRAPDMARMTGPNAESETWRARYKLGLLREVYGTGASAFEGAEIRFVSVQRPKGERVEVTTLRGTRMLDRGPDVVASGGDAADVARTLVAAAQARGMQEVRLEVSDARLHAVAEKAFAEAGIKARLVAPTRAPTPILKTENERGQTRSPSQSVGRSDREPDPPPKPKYREPGL